MTLFRSTTKNPRADVERALAAAVKARAPQLGPLAAEHGRTYVTERFELQPTFKAELQRAAAKLRPRPAVSPRLKSDLSRWYTSIGPFDVSLDWAGKTVWY